MQEKRPIAISRRFEPFDLSTRPPLFFGADDPTLCQNQGSRTHATQIITNVSSRKSERLCCARSSTPQWVYDAGAISHGVTASNLVLARILTDTLISRSPHCVLGARYDGNVNLFYVVMTGSGKPRGSRWFFPLHSISSSRFAGRNARVFGTRNPGTCSASRTRSCLYWHQSMAFVAMASCFPRTKRPCVSSIR